MASKVAIQRSRVVIIGAGFGGLSAAKALTGGPFNVTLADRYNYHLFQPLLYQVATAALSPADIAWPIRTVFRRQLNVSVVLVSTFELPLDLAPRSQRKTPPGERRGFRNQTAGGIGGLDDRPSPLVALYSDQVQPASILCKMRSSPAREQPEYAA